MKYYTLILLLLFGINGWAQDSTRVKKMNPEMAKIASKTKNNGRWVFIKEDQKLKSKDIIKNKKLFNLPENSFFKKKDSVSVNKENDFIKYEVYIDNVKLANAEVTLFNRKGEVEKVFSNLPYDIKIQNQFVLNEKEAIDKVVAKIGAKEYAWQNEKAEAKIKKQAEDASATHYPKPQKMYLKINDNLFSVFMMHIEAVSPELNLTVYIDAQTGELIKKEDNVSKCFHSNNNSKISYPAKTFGKSEKKSIQKNEVKSEVVVNTSPEDCVLRAVVPTLFYGTQAVSTYTNDSEFGDYEISSHCYEGEDYDLYYHIYEASEHPCRFHASDPNRESTKEHFTTLYCLQKTSDYYRFKFSRKGFSNGSTQNGIYVYHDAEFADNDFSNASFSVGAFKGEMKIGNCMGEDSFADTNKLDNFGTLDIIGHEFTHGVVKTETGMPYEGESGALDESFADIFGTLVYYYVKGETPTLWYHGYDRLWCGQTTPQGSYIRNLMNPILASQPMLYKGKNWKSTTNLEDDHGGVHTNSGVQNFFFYLICKGGKGVNEKGYNYDVTPIGFEKAEALAYFTLLSLSSDSDYYDTRMAWLTAAELVYGKCSQEFLSVKEAWAAVGVNAFDDFLYYCDVTYDTDIPGSIAFRDSQNQTQIGGYKEGGVPCEVDIYNSGNTEAILTARNKFIIVGNTTIRNGTKLTLKVNDPCEW